MRADPDGARVRVLTHPVTKAVLEGATSATNLGPLCEPHHVIKTETLWSLDTTPEGIAWTSPKGRRIPLDAPF